MNQQRQDQPASTSTCACEPYAESPCACGPSPRAAEPRRSCGCASSACPCGLACACGDACNCASC